MRTKALICAASLMAATLASQAQVFSVNIVGYVNTTMTGSNKFTLVSNPLDDGTNTANSILAALPNKAAIQTWNGTGYVPSSKSSGVWSPNLSLPPGTGFFVKISTVAATANVTNTFVGTVVPGPSSTNTVALPTNFVLVGSVLPVSGNLNDVGNNTLNLNATVPNKTQVQEYDSFGGTYTPSSKSSGVFSPNLPVAVGQGFFLQSKSATNWTQVLQ